MTFRQRCELITKLAKLEERADSMRGKRGTIGLEVDTVKLIADFGVQLETIKQAAAAGEGLEMPTVDFVALIDSMAAGTAV